MLDGGLVWVRRIAFGVPSEKTARLPDLNWCEMASLVPLLILVFWIGIFPNPFLAPMHTSVAHLFDQMNRAADTSLSLPSPVRSLP